MIGIIGAMDIEIDELISSLEEKEKVKIDFLDFYKGKLFGKDVVIVKSSEGKVNAAIATQVMILNFDIKYILNVGVAGALVSNISIYDIIVAKNTVEFDSDISALGYEKGYVFGVDRVILNTSDKLCEFLENSIKKAGYKHFFGTIASSDKFVVDEKEKIYINKTFDAIGVDMETASINHVATLNKVPFASFRVISDSGNNVEYTKFATEASKKIFNVLKQFLVND